MANKIEKFVIWFGKLTSLALFPRLNVSICDDFIICHKLQLTIFQRYRVGALLSFLGVQRVLNESGYKLVHPGMQKVYIFLFYNLCIPWHEVITSLYYLIRATTVFLTHPPLSRMKGKIFCFPLFDLYYFYFHLISSFDISLLHIS